MKILFEKKLDEDQTLADWIINSLKSGTDDQKIVASEDLKTIFSYSGIKIESNKQIQFTKNFMPAIGTESSTNYRPIASWGQA